MADIIPAMVNTGYLPAFAGVSPAKGIEIHGLNWQNWGDNHPMVDRDTTRPASAI